MQVSCGQGYPNEPPSVKFQTKVNFPFVVRLPRRTPPSVWRARRQLSRLCVRATPALAWSQDASGNFKFKEAKCNWTRNMSIEMILTYIKNLFQKPEYKKLPQPPDGTTY